MTLGRTVGISGELPDEAGELPPIPTTVIYSDGSSEVIP
jgi:hypothetical protein